MTDLTVEAFYQALPPVTDRDLAAVFRNAAHVAALTGTPYRRDDFFFDRTRACVKADSDLR